MDRVPRGTTFRRPFVVPHSLEELHGPTTGHMTIPLSVYWAQHAPLVVDTSNDAALISIYKETLGVATYDDLVRIINKDTLIRLWPHLTGDRTVRAAWEQRFPQLRNTPHAHG